MKLKWLTMLAVFMIFFTCKNEKPKYHNITYKIELASKYLQTKNCDRSIVIFEKILKEIEKYKSMDLKSRIYNSLGAGYLCKGDYNKALQYFELGYQMRKYYNSPYLEANSLSNIGLVYRKMENYKEALNFHQKALALYRHDSVVSGIANELINIGRVYLLMKNTDSAEYYLSTAMSYSLSTNDLEIILDNQRALADAFFQAGKFSDACFFYGKAQHTVDSILKEKTLKIADLEAKFKNEIYLKVLKIQQYRFILVSLIALVLFLLVLFIYKRYQIRLKIKEKELQSLMNELNFMKKELVIANFPEIQRKTKEISLDKEKISAYVKGKLNESDWKILLALNQNPLTTNKELSDKVNLSVPGVRSSLKKMYEIFEIDEKISKKKIALLIKVMKLQSERDF